jgi:hypothetical protein
MHDDSPYNIERLRPDHFGALQVLFDNCFGQQLKPEVIAARFDTKAIGADPIGFLAFEKSTGEPAAFYGVFPVRVQVNGETVLAAQSADTMTHQRHRKKGLFVLLAKRTIEACREEHIAFIFGQPNAQSEPGFLKHLQFKNRDRIVRWDLKQGNKSIPIHKLARAFPSLWPAVYRYRKWILSKYRLDQPPSFMNPYETDCAKLLRDEAYIRYKTSPDKIFVLVDDVLLWVKLSDVFWIGDAADYSAITPRLLKKIQTLAYRLGYNTLSFQLNESLTPPAFLQKFMRVYSEPSIFYYLDARYNNINLVVTGADFDTW